MITHPAYTVEPWCLRESELDLHVLEQSESVFALANGHIGWRGNLDEGEPHGRESPALLPELRDLHGVRRTRPRTRRSQAADFGRGHFVDTSGGAPRESAGTTTTGR